MDESSPVINSIILQGHHTDVLRLDLIHPLYGGNKFFKLKYNFIQAKLHGEETLLTFGGAHSNHIYSTAAFCKEHGLRSIGVIRGMETGIGESPTLKAAVGNGMALHFITREKYKPDVREELLRELKNKYGNFYLVPEGGNNCEGVQGCTEILTPQFKKKYDYIFCACGTGATFAGLKISAEAAGKVIGVSVLKGENTLIAETNKWLKEFGVSQIKEDPDLLLNHSTIINNYHLGGYACFSKELNAFKKEFESQYQIPLDYVYTAKLFYAVSDLIKQKKFKPNDKILVIHSGGLQGNAAFEKRYSL